MFLCKIIYTYSYQPDFTVFRFKDTFQISDFITFFDKISSVAKRILVSPKIKYLLILNKGSNFGDFKVFLVLFGDSHQIYRIQYIETWSKCYIKADKI